MRVIDDKGEHLGVMSFKEALDLATQKGLDLVEIQEKANPPVVKIVQWEKLLYREQKIERKKHMTKAGKVKGIRFTLVIFRHDLEIKASRAQEFLDKGYKVKVQIRLRRFEQDRKEAVKAKIKEFLSLITVPIAFDQKPEKVPTGYIFIIRKDSHHAENKQVSQKEI